MTLTHEVEFSSNSENEDMQGNNQKRDYGVSRTIEIMDILKTSGWINMATNYYVTLLKNNMNRCPNWLYKQGELLEYMKKLHFFNLD